MRHQKAKKPINPQLPVILKQVSKINPVFDYEKQDGVVKNKNMPIILQIANEVHTLKDFSLSCNPVNFADILLMKLKMVNNFENKR